MFDKTVPTIKRFFEFSLQPVEGGQGKKHSVAVVNFAADNSNNSVAVAVESKTYFAFVHSLRKFRNMRRAAIDVDFFAVADVMFCANDRAERQKYRGGERCEATVRAIDAHLYAVKAREHRFDVFRIQKFRAVDDSYSMILL